MITSVRFNDIIVFFHKFKKRSNHRTNKIRENIIINILNNKIPKDWYSSPQWFKVTLRLKEYIKPFEKEYGTFKKAVHISGRNNYDFNFIFELSSIKIEFKNGLNSITETPEILSVNSNTFLRGITYAEFFYDSYLSTTPLEVPCRNFYLKNIHKNKVDHPFFKNVQEIHNLKTISIHNYLENFIDFDYDSFKQKLTSQLEKKFMLWNGNNFILDSLLTNDLDIIPEKNLKKSKGGFYNTFVIKTTGTIEYHLLLRWKNKSLFPAWQISVKKHLI